ncbi:MAG: amidohydrolase family protein [Desulfurococcaceae archaeon]
MIVDIHNHFFPLEYLKSLKEYGRGISVFRDELGRMIVSYKGDYNIILETHVDAIERLKVMDKFKIDMQVLTLTTPGVDFEEIDFSVKLSRIVNDSFSDITEKYPDRFKALAVLPMQAPDLAVDELRRAVKDLGLSGVIVFSNIRGKPLDYKEFMPVYQEAERLGAPIFIHPTSPINMNFMEDYRLVPMFGFTVDTGLAVLRLILSGTLETYPSLKIVAAHLGGVLPYIIGRADKCYKMYPESKQNAKNPPSYYLGRNVHVDSICYDARILKFAVELLGYEKIMLGTDYPHQITDIEDAVDRVTSLGISAQEKKSILGLNALKLFKIEK